MVYYIPAQRLRATHSYWGRFAVCGPALIFCRSGSSLVFQCGSVFMFYLSCGNQNFRKTYDKFRLFREIWYNLHHIIAEWSRSFPLVIFIFILWSFTTWNFDDDSNISPNKAKCHRNNEGKLLRMTKFRQNRRHSPKQRNFTKNEEVLRNKCA
jgi:hypothetical protein